MEKIIADASVIVKWFVDGNMLRKGKRVERRVC